MDQPNQLDDLVIAITQLQTLESGGLHPNDYDMAKKAILDQLADYAEEEVKAQVKTLLNLCYPSGQNKYNPPPENWDNIEVSLRWFWHFFCGDPENPNQQAANRAFFYKSGCYDLFLTLYQQQDNSPLGKLQNRYPPRRVGNVAGATLWELSIIKEYRKNGLLKGFYEATLARIIYNDDHTMVGAHAFYLEVEECAKISAKAGIIHQAIKFHKQNRVSGPDGAPYERHHSCMLRVLFTISCDFSLHHHFLGTYENTSHVDYLCNYQGDKNDSLLVALTLGNIIMGAQSSTPTLIGLNSEMIGRCSRAIQLFMEKATLDGLSEDNVQIRYWISMKRFCTSLSSHNPLVSKLGLFAIAHLSCRKENRVMFKKEEDFFKFLHARSLILMNDQNPRVSDYAKHIVDNFGFGDQVPSLAGIAQHFLLIGKEERNSTIASQDKKKSNPSVFGDIETIPIFLN